MSIQALPRDVLTLILSEFRTEMCFKPVLQLVCKRWYQITSVWKECTKRLDKENFMHNINSEPLFEWYDVNIWKDPNWLNEGEYAGTMPGTKFSLAFTKKYQTRRKQKFDKASLLYSKHYKDYCTEYKDRLTKNRVKTLMEATLWAKKEAIHWLRDNDILDETLLKNDVFITHLAHCYPSALEKTLGKCQACFGCDKEFWEQLQQEQVRCRRRRGLVIAIKLAQFVYQDVCQYLIDEGLHGEVDDICTVCKRIKT
jgi:hypothetical protein